MKKIFLIISLLFAVTNLMAEPIGEKRAREIATEFLSQKMTRTTISNLQLEWAGNDIVNITRAGSDLDNSLMYIYNSAESKSFVIVGGDTNADFVLAYSLNNTFDMENMADATKAILDAWCRQIEDARKKNTPININRHSTRANNAILYQTANWSQGEPYNRKAPIIKGQYSLTGCMATAMAILCHYHKWPNNGVGTTPEYTYIDEFEGLTHTIPANELGHPYEYDKMIMSYDAEKRNYTEEQANAVATLMKDMGTSVRMSYHPDGSGAYSFDIVQAMVGHFGYSKNTLLAYGDHYSYEEWTNLIYETLCDYGPTYFGGYSPENGGHAFVVDGCDENNLFHFNFGWNGDNNGYFTLPSVYFYQRQCTLLYLEPDREGSSEYRDIITIGVNQLSGISYNINAYYEKNILDNIWPDIRNCGATTFNGVAKLVLCDKNGNCKQELMTHNVTIEPTKYVTFYVYDDISLDNLALEEGDRLRIYYKGEYSNDWQWARSILPDTFNDEILVMTTPDDLANNMQFYYANIIAQVVVSNKHPMKIDVYNQNTNELIECKMLKEHTEYSYTVQKGLTYRFEFSLGSDPYELILKF